LKAFSEELYSHWNSYLAVLYRLFGLFKIQRAGRCERAGAVLFSHDFICKTGTHGARIFFDFWIL